MAQHWDHHHGQIMAMREPLNVFADALDIAAQAVRVQKEVVIAAAVTLAAAMVATQGEALVTFGIAEGELPLEVEIARTAIKFALQELENQLLNMLINKASQAISTHISRTISNMLTGSTGIAFEAYSLKTSTGGIRNLATTIKTHANRTEQTSSGAYRRSTNRKLATDSPGGKWHVVEVLEAALLSIAADIFRQLPSTLHEIMTDTEHDLTKGAGAIEEADRRLGDDAGGLDGGASDSGGEGSGTGGGDGGTANGPQGVPLDPQPDWHGQSAGKMRSHRRPALDVSHLSPEEQIQVARDEARRLADDARNAQPMDNGNYPPGGARLEQGCAGSLVHDGVVTSHTSVTKMHGQRMPDTHPALQSLLDRIKADKEAGRIPAIGIGHGKCAEVPLLSDRLHALDPTGQIIKTPEAARQALQGAVIHTRQIGSYVRKDTGETLDHGRYLPPCNSCDPLLSALGITVDAG